jgi:hypothetical protein
MSDDGEHEEEEEERLERPRVIAKLKLTCVSLVVDSALNGDQLRLSPRILERIVNSESISVGAGYYGPTSIGRDSGRNDGDGPMVFSLEFQGKKVYGAPKEFTAKEERQVGISTSLAKALGVSVAESMTTDKGPFATLERVDIPRGSFVRLAPLTPNYLLIPDIR